MNETLSRRGVIKTILVVTATSLINNKAWARKVVNEVAAAPPGIDGSKGVARVLLSQFPALNNNGGSVRLGSSNLYSGQEGLLPRGVLFPVVITRISAAEYVALNSACAHSGYVVGQNIGGVMSCSAPASLGHGSKYNMRGQYISGPANGSSLISYVTSLANGVLNINIPDFGYEVKQTTVLNAGEKRLALTFDTTFDDEYEVRFRPDLVTLPTVVPFAIGSGTAVDQTVIKGTDTGTLTVYVLPQDGYYQVAMRMRQV